MTDSLEKTKDDLAVILDKISHADSPVGIDAKLTHAIIIDYLQNISERLTAIENRLDK